jgi:hypothetical protein
VKFLRTQRSTIEENFEIKRMIGVNRSDEEKLKIFKAVYFIYQKLNANNEVIKLCTSKSRFAFNFRSVLAGSVWSCPRSKSVASREQAEKKIKEQDT